MSNNRPAPKIGSVAAILAAAGSGTRHGGALPKQFTPLNGRAMVRWSADCLAAHERVTRILVAVGPGQEAWAREALAGLDRCDIIEGAETRAGTVWRAMQALDEGQHPDLVLIHDAARPGLCRAVIDEILESLNGCEAVAPALPVTDTVIAQMAAGSYRALHRSELRRLQTPQGFRYDRLYSAYAGRGARDWSDEITLAHAAGLSIRLTAGKDSLMKVTTGTDMTRAAHMLCPPPAACVARVGMGFDVHAFGPGDALVLCGVRIPFRRALRGHSDADVGWHALTDAILGALAAGDIGQHFPPSDPRWSGAESETFLAFARDLAHSEGYRIVNADVTLICTHPKIAPYRSAMCAATARVLGLTEAATSIKATTTESLGALGRGEGIAAQAIVGLAGT